MSISNLQVVFSPTLGISSHLLYVFVFNHEYLFPPRRESSLPEIPVDEEEVAREGEETLPAKPARAIQGSRSETSE